MKDSIEISIIIPNLHSPVIDQTINSIQRQSVDHSKIEIIIVGKDKYGLVQPSDRIKFIETKCDLNPAEARNVGIEHTKGDILFFIDADCLADKEWIKNLSKNFKDGKDVVGGAVFFKPTNYWSISDNIASFYFLLPDSERGVTEDCLGSGNLAISKKAISAVGKFDKNLEISEDVDICMQLRSLGFKTYFDPKAIVYHSHTRDSLKSLVRHASTYGSSLPKLIEKYPDKIITRNLFWSNRFLFLLVAPLKSLIHTIKIFLKHRIIWKYWYTFPGVFLFRFFFYFSNFKLMSLKK